jgi:pyruvate/2-oxoglutarate dehydrogenase complex dihydrolipoamide dehydrogenase (E3) component
MEAGRRRPPEGSDAANGGFGAVSCRLESAGAHGGATRHVGTSSSVVRRVRQRRGRVSVPSPIPRGSVVAVETYEALVIGAGQAGVPWAVALARAGRKTALVERAQVGGTCINVGCTPTKTLVASAAVAATARRAASFGIQVNGISVEMARVRQRKQEMVERFRAGGERRLQDAGVALVRGEARFTGPRTLSVSQEGGAARNLTASEFFINSGARPASPALPGLGDVQPLDSSSIMELDAVPEHLLILGGGYIAVEFGQLFRRFGARVTMVERSGQLLGREDADVAHALADILRDDGVELLFQTRATRVGRTPRGGVRVELLGRDGAESAVEGSNLLLAVGRTPNTEALDLAAAGVKLDAHGFIQVDAHLRTTAPGVFAMGDVSGAPAFTHVSYDDFRILKDNLLESGRRSTAERWVPYTLFTDPQLGRVGLTEAQARRTSHPVRVVTMPMSHVARALESGQPRGMLKAVVDGATAQVLGFAALGMEGGELASVVQVAMMGKLPYTALRDAVFPHPGLAESLNNLFGLLDS